MKCAVFQSYLLSSPLQVAIIQGKKKTFIGQTETEVGNVEEKLIYEYLGNMIFLERTYKRENQEDETSYFECPDDKLKAQEVQLGVFLPAWRQF